MPFWKRSEDPWDIDPAKSRAKQEREPVENPLDTLKDWNEERKARAAVKQAELEAQPKELCPWCGREMERGYIAPGRGSLVWTPGWMTARSVWIGPPREVLERSLRVDDEGGFTTYKTVWYCRNCEKMVINAKGMRQVNAPYTWPEASDTEEPERNIPDAQGDGEDPS